MQITKKMVCQTAPLALRGVAAVALAALLISGLAPDSFAQSAATGRTPADRNIPRIMVNGEPAPTDTAPVMMAGRVFVPIRFVAQALGAAVDWSPRNREVLIRQGSTRVQMTINDTTARQNGSPRVMEVPPIIRRGRTLIPLREAGQFLGADVSYNSEQRTVFIKTSASGGVRGDAF